ncbi:MAG: hypothetical protein P3C10_07345 [Gemmatimonadota bacterium]|nr:hypothetical protein [Gemmatimonadota bacterium]
MPTIDAVRTRVRDTRDTILNSIVGLGVDKRDEKWPTHRPRVTAQFSTRFNAAMPLDTVETDRVGVATHDEAIRVFTAHQGVGGTRGHGQRPCVVR